MLSINTTLNDIKVMSNLAKMSNKISAAMEKMSTGLKINKAKDDAANCVLSTKLNVQLREFNIFSDNIQNGMGLIDTAQSALDNMESILSRLRDLSLQGVNGTCSPKERKVMEQETLQLTQELYRIKNTTKFNNINLFDKEDRGA